MTDREDSQPTGIFDTFLDTKLSRRGVLAATFALAAAGCAPKKPDVAASSSTPSAEAKESKRPTPFEEFTAKITPEDKSRISAMEAKTPDERHKSPWSEQLLYATYFAMKIEFTGMTLSSFVDTKTGNGNDTLAMFSPRFKLLTREATAYDMLEQNCYFGALLASLGTKDTQRDLLPLVGTPGSREWDAYALSIDKNEPGWVILQELPTFIASGDSSANTTVDVEGVAVTRRNTQLKASKGTLTRTSEFVEVPLLSALLPDTASTSTEKYGFWLTVDDRANPQ